MDREELRKLAASHGLGRLDDKQLEEFGRGLKSCREIAARLPKDLHWSEESALTLSLVGKRGRR